MSAVLESYRRPFESSLTARVARRALGLYNKWPFINFRSNPHLPLVYAQHVLPESFFAAAFKFGVVRDPLSWMVSVYKHWLTRWAYDNPGISSFEEFVAWWSSFRSCTQALQFVNLDGEFIVDEVGRFENLQGFHSLVCQRLSIRSELRVLNTARTSAELEITSCARVLVENVCELDYEVFDIENNSSPTMTVSSSGSVRKELSRRLKAYGGTHYDPWASSYISNQDHGSINGNDFWHRQYKQ